MFTVASQVAHHSHTSTDTAIRMDKDAKFDRFIEDFDRSLNTDTSTIRTITSKPNPLSSPKRAATSSTSPPPHSPILTTPTKVRRNSISPEEGPLAAITRDIPPSPRHMELKPTSHLNAPSSATSSSSSSSSTQGTPSTPVLESPGVKNVRLGNSGGGTGSGLKRSSTMGGISSVHRQPSMRRGLNLGLLKRNSNNTPTPGARQHTLRSPELVTPKMESSNPIESPAQSTQQTTVTPTASKRMSMQPTMPSAGVRDRRNTGASEMDDVDDSLRVLAAKEMKVIELRHKLKLLQQELETEEQELKKLRDKVGNSIYKGISPQHNNVKNVASQSSSNTPRNDKSKRESIWSRPVSFLNQFDQLLQSEIERINKEGLRHPNEEAADSEKSSVGYSLWSFVNDVKHGLLGDDDSPTRDKAKKEETQSDEEDENQEEMVTIRK